MSEFQIVLVVFLIIAAVGFLIIFTPFILHPAWRNIGIPPAPPCPPPPMPPYCGNEVNELLGQSELCKEFCSKFATPPIRPGDEFFANQINDMYWLATKYLQEYEARILLLETEIIGLKSDEPVVLAVGEDETEGSVGHE